MESSSAAVVSESHAALAANQLARALEQLAINVPLDDDDDDDDDNDDDDGDNADAGGGGHAFSPRKLELRYGSTHVRE